MGDVFPRLMCAPVLLCSLAGLAVPRVIATELGKVGSHHVLEIAFTGPEMQPNDAPARDVELAVTFRHESGRPSVRVFGFWDGDGKGGRCGHVFKVRFCPSLAGRWRIVRTESNRRELHGQREGDALMCIASSHPGFWIADGRWYRRSDGSHPYIIGNTHYTFLSGYTADGPAASDPVEDIAANARYYKKLRFTLMGGRYVHPDDKPFLDEHGRPSDDGRHALRPNPSWFHDRVDPVVAAGYQHDLICDLILCGPDTREARSTLQGDARPWLRYIAARYGAYPNVWICLANEWDIKTPRYTAEQIVRWGEYLRAHLPYSTPVSIHGAPGDWKTALNGNWHDHAIIQNKIKRLNRAADAAARSRRISGKPVVNDENAYEGKGDRFTEADVIEGCLGTFLGGGYPTTGEKCARKRGQYFWGSFDARRHKASDNLAFLRNYMDTSVRFWQMEPAALDGSPFDSVPHSFRLLANPGREYVLGSNAMASGLRARLPDGRWRIAQIDVVAKTRTILATRAQGTFRFATSPSRAVITHFRRED